MLENTVLSITRWYYDLLILFLILYITWFACVMARSADIDRK